MNELDHLQIDLSGRNLIEASAGTGKTFAIACLYLRLVIEAGLTPDQILVVTYTEAATEELRGRVRTRLREALEVCDGAATDDVILRGIVTDENGRGPGRDETRSRLLRALTSFDLAAIFTIHGFCLRALQDNAFESGSLYDTELVTDQKPLLREVVDDFWRMKFFSEPAPLLGHALQSGLTPETLLSFLAGMTGNPELEILPSFTPEEVVRLDTACQPAFSAVAAEWTANRAAIVKLIHEDKGLSRDAKLYKLTNLPAFYAGMDAFVAGGNPFATFGDLYRFTTSGIAAGTKKTGTPPWCRFFELCQALSDVVTQRFLALRWELVAFARERLPARKREANIRFFDDLLADLYAALRRDQGAVLAGRLRDKYRAALIDEFQDTDPVQYDIFRKIYDDPACPLFLIGDPKQAIYSFRGADIFAYLEAAADVAEDRTFTLTGNWRSSPRLLAALNRIFDNERRPFVFDRIVYHPVQSGDSGKAHRFELTDGDDAPLQVWSVLGDGAGMKVGDANRVIPVVVAGEISRLLRAGQVGTARIDGRAVLPEDMAVIVRDKYQAASVQEALRQLGIPSVTRSDRSLFDTDEAREVCTLMAALADPASESRVRAALVTDLLGRRGDDIARLGSAEQEWDACLQRFRDWRQTWLQRGFMVMAQALIAAEGVRGRLLSRPDGERRLTNLFHCLEVIHQAAHERRLGIEGLVTWFSQRVSSDQASEEHQIRLETDEKAVKIVTVHVSKGLEYPIVFCPFLWGGIRGLDNEVVTFHRDFRMVKDFGSTDHGRHRVLAGKESLAENLRLLYVALTRAKYRCYLVGGKFLDKNRRSKPDTSPLAYLFHASPETRAADDVVTRQDAEVRALDAGRIQEQLEALAAGAAGDMAVLPLPDDADAVRYCPEQDDGAALCCIPFTGQIDRSWRVSSFTALAVHETLAHDTPARQAPSPEAPDRDRTGGGGPVSADDDPAAKSIFTFPRGARAGIFLHEIFEKLDFSAGYTGKVAETVTDSLRRHNYSPEWHPPVCAMVQKVLAAPVGEPENPFTLGDLRPGSWLVELEFFFPLKFVTSDSLKRCLARWGHDAGDVDLPELGKRLRFSPVQGMVRGFMDLVLEHGGRYYLVDWKSNHLGNRVEEYGPAALRAEMARNLYPLQYLLYTVALNRYLALRVRDYDYDTHFGGVRYLFLRGIDPERAPEFGIFPDRPPAGLIRELTECLMAAGGRDDL